MNDRKRAEVEVEGGGTTWFFVCGECHAAVNYRADECRNCHCLLIWDGCGKTEKKIYIGEQTEPAE